MPGPLAAEVVSLVNDTVSKFEYISKIYSAAIKAENNPTANAEDLPSAFHDVGKHVPIVRDALKAIEDHIWQRQDDKTCTGMKTIAEECEGKADCLKKLFSKVVPSDKKMESYRMAVRDLDNKNRVEDLMKDAMQDVKLLLTVDDEMQLATKSHIELLDKSMEEVSAIPQSLQDESPALGIHNYGSGPQNVNTGSGPQNNNNDKGIQVNGGTFTNVNPFQPQ